VPQSPTKASSPDSRRISGKPGHRCGSGLLASSSASTVSFSTSKASELIEHQAVVDQDRLWRGGKASFNPRLPDLIGNWSGASPQRTPGREAMSRRGTMPSLQNGPRATAAKTVASCPKRVTILTSHAAHLFEGRWKHPWF